MKKTFFFLQKGQSLVEIILVMGISMIILPALLTGMINSRQGKVQQAQRTQAVYLLNETADIIRNVREKGWTNFAVNGTYHTASASGSWALATGSAIINGFNQSIEINDIARGTDGVIVSSGGTIDPSSKKVNISISWDKPYLSTVSAILYMTRYLSNNSFTQTTAADFSAGTTGGNTQVINVAGGEVILANNNNKAKWCSPAFSTDNNGSEVTIDLPDGPPVAVVATASAVSSSIPNDVFVATAPYTTNSIKLAYVNVTANTDPPQTTLRGKFTLNASEYSNPSYVPSGLGLTNSFKTNDIKYYKSSSGKTYALLATDLPSKEVIAVLVNDADSSNDNNTSGEYQDPVNKIYKYWTFFDTIKYNGVSASADTGYLNPSANSVDTGGDGDGFGTNPSRAYSDNSSFAVDTNSGNGTGTDCLGTDKDKHRFYNYNISVPSGATIDGIEVRLDAKADSTVGSPKMCIQLSSDGGATWTTPKLTSNLTTNEASYILGGSTDKWGKTWSDTNFTNANFRLRVINVASSTSRDFSLDWTAVKVYYNGVTDQSPFDYGATSLATMEDRGYLTSGGYLYVFDLSNIDSKTSTDGLDMIGCRIELDGFDCLPGNGMDRKYSAGETGASWSTTTAPMDPETCRDAGNIELYATNDIYPVQVGANSYVFIAVGAATDPEFEIAKVTNIPTSGTSPTISSNSCGRISGGNTGWKMIKSLDFNSKTGTQEAANSVFAKSDGTRAYISSNGSVDGNNDGIPDSKQLYILNTHIENDSTVPTFLSGVPGSPSYGPLSGFYYGTGADSEMYPRRSLTVLNGERVVLVGKDGISNGNDAQEYQVLNSGSEASPTYCGGINFNSGFNDLTSVSEADGDNFVYMVANTMEKQLKIIQGGPDTGIYTSDGVFASSVFDANVSSSFYRFDAIVNQPNQTTIKAQVGVAPPIGGNCSAANFNFIGPSGNSSDYFTAVSSVISGIIPFGTYANYQNPEQCIKFKFFLDTLDYNQTPTLYDIKVNYSP